MEPHASTVLIVDDVVTNVRMLQNLLKDDHRILFATNGPEALDLVLSQRPDLVLLDVMMPEMDGYEVCRRLKEMPETADIPVIFVSALGDEEEEAQGLGLGAIDYVTKPVSPSIVRARVRNHLELKRRGDLLKAAALRDPLTGIPNYQCFEEAIATECRRCLRSGRPLSIILFDLERFMDYNERRGYQQGDRRLCRVAGFLKGELRRPGDMVARFGGGRFAALLPEVGEADAAATAERICRRAAETLAGDEPEPLCLNVGVASMPNGAGARVAADGLVAQAERALSNTRATRAAELADAPPTTPPAR